MVEQVAEPSLSMSDIKLFRLSSGKATELQGDASDLEKPLQTLIEANLEPLLGIRFLATEYSTGKTHGGRIDSLGLDENNCPVILEYKRSVGENVINQGLFYLDWLMDHQAEFKLLVMDKLGNAAADAIDWSAPRLVCIAADFTKYDGHAVQQINRNIELIRYRRFGDELLLLELANATSGGNGRPTGGRAAKPAAIEATPLKPAARDRSFAEWLPLLPAHLAELLSSLEDYVMSLGDDVQRKELRLYLAFKRLKNFATVVAQKNRLLESIPVAPETLINAKGKKVLVIGGGDTGSDCVGTANRQKAVKITQIEILDKPPVGYNPTTPWPSMYPQVLKTSSSHEEGCERRWNLTSCRFIGEKGVLKGVEVEEVVWTKGDDGRVQMQPTGKKEIIEADLVFLAMGFVHPVQEGLIKSSNLATDNRKNIIVDKSFKSSASNVFACGDATTGASLVVKAMAAGRDTAKAIDSYLSSII